jgi:hypothetical protein
MEWWHMGIGGVLAAVCGLVALRAVASSASSSASSGPTLEPLDLNAIRFVPARFFKPGPPEGRQIDVLVFHTAETGEGPTSAEGVAAYFKDPRDQNGNPVMASAHYSGDSNSIVQSVKDRDIAHAAPPMNDHGLHFELAGRANQSAEQWSDDFSRAELELAARWAAAKAEAYAIPLKWVDREGLKRGERGFTTHFEVSKAFGQSTHQDPGPNFPAARFLELVGSVRKAA